MNIIIVNTRHYYGGGDSTYSFLLSDLLRQRSHTVQFMAMEDSRNLPDPNTDLFVSNIDFRTLNKRKNPITALQVLTRSIYSYEASRKFSLLLDRVKPDLVHLQNIHAHITPSVIFEAKRRGIPVVWTLHDYKLVCPNSHFLIDRSGKICEACRGGRFYNAPLKQCKKGSFLASSMAALEAYIHKFLRVRDMIDAFLCPSMFLHDRLLENGFPQNKVYHLPLFLTTISPNPNQANDGYILYLGRLEAIKGIYMLLKAARHIPNVKILLAGRLAEEIEPRLNSLLPSNVEYLGIKSGQELDTIRRNALAFVVPSIWYENQPFSILEAFASGKPVIASNLGGMTELVAHKQRGLLVPPGDVTELAAAMEYMVKNPDQAAEWGKNAFDYAATNHSAESHYAQLLEIYHSVL